MASGIETMPGAWLVSEHARPRNIVSAVDGVVTWRYRSTSTKYSTLGWCTAKSPIHEWFEFLRISKARAQWSDPDEKKATMAEPNAPLEEILRDIPAEAAEWVRKHAATFADLPADIARIVAAKIQRGDSAEAEAVIYQSLTREQRTEWNTSRLEELRLAVDKRLARKAALAEGIATAASIGTAFLSSIGGALTMAITAGALKVADRIAEAGD
jgi:hypothetical protein